MTTRGFKVPESIQVGNWIADILENPNDSAMIDRVRAEVGVMTKQFPVYGA
jgi:glycine hydroxymethyltransferase